MSWYHVPWFQYSSNNLRANLYRWYLAVREKDFLKEYLGSGELRRLMLFRALLLTEDGTLTEVTNERTQWILEPFHFVLSKAPVPDREGSVHWHIQTPCNSKLSSAPTKTKPRNESQNEIERDIASYLQT